METNHRTLEECRAHCQFVRHSLIIDGLECGHCNNVLHDNSCEYYFMNIVSEYDICDRYTKPYSISEEDFNKIIDKTKEMLARNCK